MTLRLRPDGLYGRWRWLPLAAIAAAGLLLSAAAGLLVARAERLDQLSAFNVTAHEYAETLEYAIGRHRTLVRATEGAFEAVGTLGPNAFREFVAHLTTEAPSLKALEWAPRVQVAERERFEAAIRADVAPDFHIHADIADDLPALPSPMSDGVHVPVIYIAPMKGNEPTLGLDLASDAQRRSALMHAAETGSVVATPPIPVWRESDDQANLLLIAPVDAVEEVPATMAAPWHRVAGFVIGVFRIETLVRQAFGSLAPAPFDVYVYDGSAPDIQHPVLHYGAGNRTPPSGTAWRDPLAMVREIDVADRTWTLLFTPYPDSPYVASTRHGWLTAAMGLAMTLFIACYAWSLQWRSRRIEQLAHALTAANAHLTAEVSARATAEAAAQTASRKVEAASLARTKFFAAASHDLRQPLQAARLFAHLLRNRLTEPTQVQMAEKLEESLNASEALLKTLLDVSTLEAGTVKPHITVFEIGPFLERVGREFEDQAATHGLSLRVHPGSGVVASDPTLLQRMISNLLTNAIRYTPHGGILLAGRRRERTLRVEVWDSGIGIPSDKTDDIFEDFRRLDTSGERGQGLGLGLSVVARMARLLDHGIEVRSHPGKGSRFTIVVPLATDQSATPREPKASTAG